MLTTLDRLKKSMGIPLDDTSMDEQLILQLITASQAIENRCMRSFKKGSYTDIASGDPKSKYINLVNSPLHLVQAVNTEDGPVTGFIILADGRLFRKNGWPCGEHNITVTYEAGYTLPEDATPESPKTLPAPLELACILYAQTMMRAPGVTSERVGDISVSYASNDDVNNMPAAVFALIQPYIGRWV